MTGQKPGTSPPGQQRSNMYENLADPMSLTPFAIQIIDGNFNPVQNEQFKVSSSQSSESTVKTDSQGSISTTQPQSGTINLTLASDSSGSSSSGQSSNNDSGQSDSDSSDSNSSGNGADSSTDGS